MGKKRGVPVTREGNKFVPATGHRQKTLVAGADRGGIRVIHGPSVRLWPSDRPPRGGPAEDGGGRGTSVRHDRRVARADGMAKDTA